MKRKKSCPRLRESPHSRNLCQIIVNNAPEVAVGVEEEVRGLEVSVQHVGRVDVLQSPVRRRSETSADSMATTGPPTSKKK